MVVKTLTRLRDTEHGGLNGWLEAGLFVLAISALTVVYAIAQRSGAHTLVFTFHSMAAAAAGMLAITGLGSDALKTIRARQSWFYGAAAIGLEGLYFALVGVIKPAEASLSLRLAVPVSIVFGWLFLSRVLTAKLALGGFIIVAAVLPIFWALHVSLAIPALVLAISCALLITIKTFASEFHPSNQRAQTAFDKLRITGLVVLSTALLGAAFLVSAVVLTQFGFLPRTPLIPEPSAFWHLPTLLFAVFGGAPIFVSMTYLTFSAVLKIGTERFLASTAFAPFTAVALETLAARFGLLSLPHYDWQLMPLIVLGIVGVIIVIRDRNRLLPPTIRAS